MNSTQTLLATLALAFASTLPAIAAPVDPPGVAVVRDPITGEMRAPTAAELRALRELGPARAPAAPLQAEVRPDGSRRVRLDERHQIHATVTRDANGKTVLHCTQGHSDATENGHEKH